MDIGYKLTYDNPIKSANVVSKLFFIWMIDAIRKIKNKCFELKDLYKILDKDKSERLGNKLEKNWNNELKRAKLKESKPRLLKAIFNTFVVEFMLYGILYFIYQTVIRCSRPLLIAKILDLFAEENFANKTQELYIYSSVLIGIIIIDCFVMHHCNQGLYAIGMRIRIASSALIYRKITRLNQNSLGQTAAGKMVNLLSNDVNRFDLVMQPLHALWVIPFQIVLVTYFIWSQVGISSLSGIISMCIIGVPIQGYLGTVTGKLRAIISKKTDTRVKLMNEIISGIQVIKMYAWEKPFEIIIKHARAAEIKYITRTSYIRGILASCAVFLDRTALCITIICYVLLGNVITAAKVFSLVQAFNILQAGVCIWYPLAISMGAESLVSIKRLQDFLMLDEKEHSRIKEIKTHEIVLNNVNASWTDDKITLKDITLRIPPGVLCTVVGPVGAGKSSLFQVLLGELPTKSGHIQMGGIVTYSSQEPWLFQSTVRKNILFGKPYEKLWYQRVVKICALERDFDQFPDRDKTIVGERGVSLSGGQRARINLARAIYSQANIYLLDDPLSAVDTNVGKHLFEKCIVNELRGKTRILVTHQLQFLKSADLVIVLNGGKIEAQGTYEELSNSNLNFSKLLGNYEETEEIPEKNLELPFISPKSRKVSLMSAQSELSENIEIMQVTTPDNEEAGSDPNSRPFLDYLAATKNICLLVFLIFMSVSAQGLCAATDWWVAYWTNHEEIRRSIAPLNNPFNSSTTNLVQSYGFDFNNIFDHIKTDYGEERLINQTFAMYTYGILLLGAISFTLARSILFFKMCMMSSTNLHSKLFGSMLKAPMRFFNINPSGRILNRFSKDIGSVDEFLPRFLIEAVQISLVMFGILINVAISNPYVIIAMVVLAILFMKLKDWYMSSARTLKHLEGIAKSPVFSHLNSTLNGLGTIRAANTVDILIDEFDEHQDVHTSAWYLVISTGSTFGLWFDIICVIFITMILFSFFLLLNFSEEVNSSMVGLALSQSLVLTGMVQYGMRAIADVVSQLTSVERVVQYTKLETEGPFESPKGNVPNVTWPQEGLLEFTHVSLKYVKDDPPVLNNLTFRVLPGQKIGIVGRTGAGKSSLIAALFRLAPLEGSILIDNIDTQSIGLSDLRKKISIIPQEPVLFSATLRYNLDPFAEFSDQQIWKALEQVDLKNSVESLDFMVSEGGSNFSLGQRQLVCLARAALRNNKILVLDEATANVDLGTDSFIQNTVRTRFKDCTVLTIAHRLNTIMDSDKVLVMDIGKLVEFDHPHKLLQIPDGYFHKMVLETGTVTSAQLKEIALEAYNKSKQTVQETGLIEND